MKRLDYAVVACPHCEQKIVLEADEHPSSMTCPNCGAEFSLVEALLVPFPITFDPRVVAAFVAAFFLSAALVAASVAYVCVNRYSREGAVVFDRLTGKSYSCVHVQEPDSTTVKGYLMTVVDNVNAKVSAKMVESSDLR